MAQCTVDLFAAMNLTTGEVLSDTTAGGWAV